MITVMTDYSRTTMASQKTFCVHRFVFILAEPEASNRACKMPVVPTVMVLYTNDAVEVRYSDGSRLQMSPCGASMFHQDPPTDETHPLAGVNTVHKRTQFVTSVHKGKVLQALDFRNRFAQRPLRCPSFMQPEDIMSLFAQIDKVAWPKSLKDATSEVLEDGSRRVVSLDEFATVVLSPHGQDFTVCYLSRVSEDTSRDKSGAHSKHGHSHGSAERCGKHASVHFQSDCGQDTSDGCKEGVGARPADINPSSSKVCSTHLSGGHIGAKWVNTQNESGGAENQNQSTSVREQASESQPQNGDADSEPAPEEADIDASGIIVSDGTVSTPSIVHTRKCTDPTDPSHSTPPSKLNISPIQHDISSISRVSTPDGLRGLVECDSTLSHGDDTTTAQQEANVRHSSPLSPTNRHKTAREKNAVADDPTLRGSPLLSTDPSGGKTGCAGAENELSLPKPPEGGETYSPKSDKACQTQASDKLSEHKHKLPSQKADGVQNMFAKSTAQHSDFETHRCLSDLQEQRLPSDGAQVIKGFDTWSAVRQHYTWVTQHMSCSDCPPAWRHPLKLLQQMDPSDAVLVTECQLPSSTAAVHRLQKTSTVDSEDCVLSPLASPLPLSCPFQHLHAWQPHHLGDGGEGECQINEFKQGQLKVIMMEGVVYRFVHLANMRVVEVYPGDGSVFVSQGITGHYFLHIVYRNGKLEEKTYSLKALPPSTSKSPYSIEKLIKRAHRFLTGCIENSKLSEREDLPCWKHVPTQVVEPLSTSVLEDCSVPGYGRFTAYTNGRIRIVFDDRTALDMVADFSGRLQRCLHHSQGDKTLTEKLAAVHVSSLDKQLGARRCRLLLPAGKYVTLDIDKPGIYRRYVDAALEWIQWVQSSPKERCQFYQNKDSFLTAQMSAEAELKKIECFNYIVDHSGKSGDSPTASPARPTATQSHHPLPGHTVHFSPPQASYGNERTVFYHAVHSLPTHMPMASSIPSSQSHGASYALQLYDRSQYSSSYVPYISSVSHLPSSSTLSSVSQSHIPPVKGQQMYIPRNPVLSDPKGLELMQGFNSVREALLRTSQMIKDIDEIVKDKKRSSH